ncbi:MAG: MBOAT family O-acyltransferase [Planctomycetota bacterium]
MVFTSWTFLVFLAVVLPIYYSLNLRAQNVFLTLASYVFYGWWDYRFCGLMIISTFLDYTCALIIDTSSSSRVRRAFLTVGIVGNLSMLSFFKYFNFFVDSAVEALRFVGMEADPPVLNIILPVGISFYTFQTMSYTIDVYRREMPACRDLVTFFLYISYFPQLVAGPIERAPHLLPQFSVPRVVDNEKIFSGLVLILLGFFKKIAIADVIAPDVEAAYSQTSTATWYFLYKGVWLFAIQVYCDFSGYSDIARGTSRLLGVELMENFNQPLMSASITEFWRRWHISLSSWIRDYVYIPLGGNRDGVGKSYRNLMLAMTACGIWHGAGWNYVLWGALQGFFLSVHKWMMGGRKFTERPLTLVRSPRDFSVYLFKWWCNINLVLIGFVFFRSPTFHGAMEFFEGLVTFRGGFSQFMVADAIDVAWGIALVMLLDVPQYLTRDHTIVLRWPWPVQGLLYGSMLFLMTVMASGDETPFVYFQF